MRKKTLILIMAFIAIWSYAHSQTDAPVYANIYVNSKEKFEFISEDNIKCIIHKYIWEH